ncbi:MAG TPA: DMT family transporter [Candidatus Binatia bacterium]|nr:DMT family transporter [Candidatus Binatia bacterium]
MVLAVILSGIGPVLVRDSPVDPAATAFWRLFLGLPLALFLVRRSVMLPPRTMFWAALGGLLLSGDLMCWNRSLVTTTILEGTVLVMVYPVITAVANYLIFRERITLRLAIGGGIAFLGLLMMVVQANDGGQSSVSGDLWALGAAGFYAFSLLISARLCRAHDTQVVSFWLIFWASVGAAPVGFLIDARSVPQSLYDWVYIVGYAAITVASYSLFNRGLKTVPTAMASLMGYGQPVVATLLGFFFLEEAPTVMNVLGSIVIVIGLILATRPNRNGKLKPIEEPQ